MKVVNYNENTKISGYFPEIKKLGFCSPNAEMTPFVWKGRLMRLELCWGRNGNDYVIETTHSLIRDVQTGEVISRTAYGMCFTSGYLEGDTFYVLATVGKGKKLCGNTIKLYYTNDLVNWKERELFHREG